jgi:NAD(P)-dependent dehydrogenase (short-subunit alcohol dehydrogenase family)
MAFHGRVAVVTGGGSGMGQIFARRMADEGAQVALLDVNASGMEETRNGRPNVHAYTCDVSDESAVVQVIGAIEREYGPIDRLVHAAAIMPASPLLADDPSRVKRVMRINYEGTVNLTYAVLPKMIARDGGDFIVFSSVAAYVPAPHLGAYAASKSAVAAFVECLIWENRDCNVRIHLALPPLTLTPLLDQALATAPPRSLQKGLDRKIAADPAVVVEAIERSIEKGRSISTPGAMAKGLLGFRRLSPSLLWKFILREERA